MSDLGAQIQEEMQKECNMKCADCGHPHPKWVSTNIGIFICLQCSSIHRSLGTDFSQVRSITLDALTKEQAKRLLKIGNDKANQYWEHNLPKDFHRPNWESKDTASIANFIKDKYVNKKWAPKIDYQTYLKTGETEIKKEENTSKEPEAKEFPTFDLLGLC